MSYRPFWQHHPLLARAFALAALVLMPVLLPLIALVVDWRSIVRAVATEYREQYREAWHVLIKGVS